MLLLDEVLAVGDEAFQRKCFGRIFEFRRRGGTLVFVSHDPAAVERVCDRAILLVGGDVVADGAPADVLAAYHRLLAGGGGAGGARTARARAAVGRPGGHIDAVRLVGADGPDRPLHERRAAHDRDGREAEPPGARRRSSASRSTRSRAPCYGTNTRMDSFAVDELTGARPSASRSPPSTARGALHGHRGRPLAGRRDRVPLARPLAGVQRLPGGTGVGAVDAVGQVEHRARGGSRGTAPSERPDPDPLDVEALMEDLRRRVAEKKAQGLYGVDALMEASTEDAGEPFGLDELERLRELAVQRVDIEVTASTKPVVGGVVSRLKRLLVRGTSQPMYGLSAQTTAFNGALLAYLSSLAREVRRSSARCGPSGGRRGRARRGGAARGRAERRRREVAPPARPSTLADAALPERIARLERAPAPAPGVESATPAPAGPSACAWRRPRTTRAGAAPGGTRGARAAGPRCCTSAPGAGATRAARRGPEGVEPDRELAAAAAAEERHVRHADPVAFLAARLRLARRRARDRPGRAHRRGRAGGPGGRPRARSPPTASRSSRAAPAGLGDPAPSARPRPAPAAASRRRADGARGGRPRHHPGRGTAPGATGLGAAPLRRACGPLTGAGSPSSSPGTAPAWSAARRCSAA